MHRIGWLRAAVLGANDGIVSTASLILGVAAADASTTSILIAGVAGLVAGSMSMAAGEYVSVSSQADTESADLEKERRELAEEPEHEHAELTAIYVERGLDRPLASEVATQLMDHDALAAHARDELGIFDKMSARPVQAAFASAGTFAVGAALPLIVVLLAPLGSHDVGCGRKLTGVPRAAGLPVGPGRRRFRADCSHPRHLLGRPGHGFDRWRGDLIWRDGLIARSIAG